jgi:hypothetical protein
MNVKRTLLLVAAGCGAIAFGLQQQPQKYVLINDNSGGFKVYDVESALTTFTPGGDVAFEASGRPMKGFSKEQGLNFAANRMEGVAVRTGEGSFRLKNGRAAGAVVVDVVSTTSEGGATSRTHLESESFAIVETENESTFTLPSKFVFTNRVTSGTVDRLLEVRAPSGTFVLPLLNQAGGGSNPFRSADVKGPVEVTIDSKTKVTAGTSGQVVRLRADRMTYNGDTRILRLEGNITGNSITTIPNQKPLDLDMVATWITIELTSDSAVKEIKSGVGTASIRQGGGQ